MVGVFDTCLHVAIVTGGATSTRNSSGSSLLQSAAADALGHCVIVVFGMRGDNIRAESLVAAAGAKRHDGRSDGNADDDTLGLFSGDPTTVDASSGCSDSDDDWGERDPAVDDMISCNDGLLVNNKS